MAMTDHARFAYVLRGGEWVPKQRAQTDGGKADE